MEHTYFIFDGDKIGDVLARAYLSNSEEDLVATDKALRTGLAAAERWLRERSMFMITSGADGITCRGGVSDLGELFLEVNQLTKPFSFSLGCGKTLREAFICLRFAKASGRRRWAKMDQNGRIIVFEPKVEYGKKHD
jgi:hypothetical protein